MKIKIILIVLFAMSSNGMAIESDLDSGQELREIIGSGIFDVNKTRKFLLDSESKIYLDKEEVNVELFEIIGSGFKSTFTVNKDVNSTVDSGTINALELTTNLKGPVTSIIPFMILEQEVLQTSDTVKAYPSKIFLNQNMAVSGYLSDNNSLKATRVMTNDSDWKIRGFASNVNQFDFNVGSLQINRASEQIIDCENGFDNDALVEVKMAIDPNYQVGFAINTIQSIRCLSRNQLAGEQLVLPSVIQGFISQTQGQDFWLNDVRVNVNKTTEYVNGEIDFIEDAVNVEVQGSFDTATSEINADSIRFIDHRIEITFPVQPEDIANSESVTLLGQTFHKTPQTKDNAGIFSPGINQPIQLQIQGYIDSEGQAYITKTLDKGVPDLNAVSLRGNVSALNNPELTLMIFVIDASQSQIIQPGSGIIDINTFFEEIDEGSQIELKNAKYNSMTNMFTEGTIKIRKSIDQPVSREIIGSGIFGAYVTATITATADQIFVSGFE